MPVEVELVHAEPGRRVVLARWLEGGEISATALGEGSDAEEAEDRARARLGATTPGPAPIPKAVRPQPATNAVSLPAPVAIPVAAPIASEPAAPAAKTTQQPSFELSSPGPAPSQANSTSEVAHPAPLEPAADPEDWSSELANLDLQLK
ncbi:MAG: hypothetical protein VKM98_01125, partial [Cyanobacteriota bacterium]|nr:hypothetical protein [Cyanobacteriota bacterium]